MTLRASHLELCVNIGPSKLFSYAAYKHSLCLTGEKLVCVCKEILLSCENRAKGYTQGTWFAALLWTEMLYYVLDS